MKKFKSSVLITLCALIISIPVFSQVNASLVKNSNTLFSYQKQIPFIDGNGFSTTTATSVVLPGNNSTSNNGRAPQGSRRFINSKYIILNSEMIVSGFSGAVSSIGWKWNVSSPPASSAPTSQNTPTTGNIRVYLKDTSGTALSIGSTTIDTNGIGYTKIIDGTINIPSGLAEINIDVPVGGPGTSSFTPTPGSAILVIYVYKTTTDILPTLLGSPTCFCNNTGGGPTITTYQSQIIGGVLGSSSIFRPETRFGIALKQLDLTMFIQGFYNSVTHKMAGDTVNVYLRNSSSPYAILDSAKSFVNSSGHGTFIFSNVFNGTNFYLELRHRNSVETWSKTTQMFTGYMLTYNFTTAAAKAYGDNMTQIDASPLRYGIYSGDVNQSGSVDLSDVTEVYNDARTFLTGYVVTDVTGNNIVDLNDLTLVYNNSVNFVVRVIP